MSARLEAALRAPGMADGVGLLLNDLLTIQGDLSRAWVWLADHWSDDLPELRWLANGYQGDDGPAIRLLGACVPSELTRVADLLGVVPVDDDEPDSYGSRYRRVRRDFGLVRIDVFHAIGSDVSGEGDR